MTVNRNCIQESKIYKYRRIYDIYAMPWTDQLSASSIIKTNSIWMALMTGHTIAMIYSENHAIPLIDKKKKRVLSRGVGHDFYSMELLFLMVDSALRIIKCS